MKAPVSRRADRLGMPQERNASAGRQGSSPAAGGTSAPALLPGADVLSWTVRVGIALVLATPLVVAPDVFYPFVIGKAVYARSLIELTLPAWVALVLFFPERRPPWSWTLFAFAVWLPLGSGKPLVGEESWCSSTSGRCGCRAPAGPSSVAGPGVLSSGRT